MGKDSLERQQVVTMLTKMLEEAKRGNITSAVAVTFNAGNVNGCYGEFTEWDDVRKAPEAWGRVEAMVAEMSSGVPPV